MQHEACTEGIRFFSDPQSLYWRKSETCIDFEEYLAKKPKDMSIEVEELKIQVHRELLKMRSDVFNTMLEQPLRENTEGVLTITDFPAATVKHMVQYMYTDSCPPLDAAENDVQELLELTKIAHKYEIKRLLSRCEEKIILEYLDANTPLVVLETAATLDLPKVIAHIRRKLSM